MQPGPVAVVRQILERHPITEEPRRLATIIQSVILDAGWEEHESFAAEIAELWEGRVANRLRSELNALLDRG